MVTFLLVAGSLHKETSRSIRPKHPPTRACVRLYQREGRTLGASVRPGSRRLAGGGDRGRSSAGGVNDRGRGRPSAAGGGEGGRGRTATEAGRERVLAAGGDGARGRSSAAGGGDGGRGRAATGAGQELVLAAGGDGGRGRAAGRERVLAAVWQGRLRECGG